MTGERIQFEIDRFDTHDEGPGAMPRRQAGTHITRRLVSHSIDRWLVLGFGN